MANESKYDAITFRVEELGIDALIIDYGILKILQFKPRVDANKVSMTIERPFIVDRETRVEDWIEAGTKIIENYMKDYNPDNVVITMLHYWFVSEREHMGESYIAATGRVCGHYRLEDSHTTYTSRIMSMEPDYDKGVMVINTRNTCYVCPLAYCDWEAQEREGKELIPDYDKIKLAYANKRYKPSIEPGNILLTISNYDEYYFHSVYYKASEETEPELFFESAHIGMFQDSVLVFSNDCGIDIRYFPHYHNIEFYMEPDKPMYVENIGYCPLTIKSSSGIIRIDRGERKLVSVGLLHI